MKKYKLTKRYRTENLQKVIGWGVFVTIVLMCVLCFCGCKSIKQTVEVPVYIHDTTHVTHTEFVFRTDTMINNTETIIREATVSDSALLAKIGLQLKENERTILVLRNELLQKTHQLEQSKQDSTYQHNETPVSLKETNTVEVEKPLRWWQKTFIGIGVVSLLVLIGLAIWKNKKWWIKLFV